jgi:hypothetical protein
MNIDLVTIQLVKYQTTTSIEKRMGIKITGFGPPIRCPESFSPVDRYIVEAPPPRTFSAFPPERGVLSADTAP